MSNYKQSSVEWFGKESWKLRVELEDEKISLGEYANKYYQLKQQAKAKHKEECIKYYVDGVDYGDMGQHIRESLIQIAEKIYNETFGE